MLYWQCIGLRTQYLHFSMHTLWDSWTDYWMGSFQSVPSWLELELAWAKKFKLGWLSFAWWQNPNPSLAFLGLTIFFCFWTELGLGSEQSEIYELSSNRAQGKWKWKPNWSTLKVLLYLDPFSLIFVNYYPCQSIGNLLNLERAQTETSELGWLNSAH